MTYETSKSRNARALQMAKLLIQGYSKRRVGEIFGVSRQRVQQIVSEILDDLRVGA